MVFIIKRHIKPVFIPKIRRAEKKKKKKKKKDNPIYHLQTSTNLINEPNAAKEIRRVI